MGGGGGGRKSTRGRTGPAPAGGRKKTVKAAATPRPNTKVLFSRPHSTDPDGNERGDDSKRAPTSTSEARSKQSSKDTASVLFRVEARLPA